MSSACRAAAVIGFIGQPYNANESDGEVFVELGVIEGMLQREVLVQLMLAPGSALGKYEPSGRYVRSTGCYGSLSRVPWRPGDPPPPLTT